MNFGAQKPKRFKHRRAVVTIAAIVLIFAALGSTALWTNDGVSGTVSKKEAAQTVAASQPAQAQELTTQPATTAPATAEPALDDHGAYPEDVRADFIKDCASGVNKESTCVCSINYIQQRYTIDEYTTISQNPESRQYQDMVAAAYDNNDCT